MRLQDLGSSKAVIQSGLFLAQRAPPRMAHGLGRAIAALITRRKPDLYWTVRANLRQMSMLLIHPHPNRLRRACFRPLSYHQSVNCRLN